MGFYTERGKYMKRRMLGVLSLLLCLLMIVPLFTVAASAETVTYRKGANDVSSATAKTSVTPSPVSSI